MNKNKHCTYLCLKVITDQNESLNKTNNTKLLLFHCYWTNVQNHFADLYNSKKEENKKECIHSTSQSQYDL